MIQQKPDSSKMRVAVISASRNQREHLRRLIEEHGPKVVGASGFRDYNATIGSQKPDVLLIDLDQADDAALDRMERLIEQSKIPILFNESTAIPLTPGPYRDDWLDNLVGKLFNLAQKQDAHNTSALLDRPRYTNTGTRFALPKVLVISHSKTRRRVLQIILASQAIKDTAETSFAEGYRPEAIKAYDVLLLDEHNVGPEDAAVFDQILAQSEVPVKLCNSSRIPHSESERNRWGIQLSGQLIKIFRSVFDNPVPNSANEMPENLLAVNWAAKTPNEVFQAIAPTTPQKNAALATAKPTQSKSAARKLKNEDGRVASTLRAALPLSDLKYRPPKVTVVQSSPSTTSMSVERSGPVDATNFAKTQNESARIRVPEQQSSKTKESDLFDAAAISLLADNDSWVKSIAALSQEERDSEISRFFNFEVEPVAPSDTKKESKKQSNAELKAEKKSIQDWFRSLVGIRQKLPKMFH